MTFTDREIALEAEMAERGKERRRASRSRTRARGKESLTSPGRTLVKACLGRVVKGLEGWVREQRRRKASNRAEVLPLVQAIRPRVAALLACRCCLDAAASGQSWNQAVHELARRLDEERMGRWLAKEHGPAWAAMRRRAHHVPQRAAARLRRAARLKAADEHFRRWSFKERIRVGAFFLSLVEQTAGLIRVREEATVKRRTQLVLEFEAGVAEWLRQADAKDELLEPLYMPMLDAPGDWGPGLQGGYSTGLVQRQYLVKNRSRLIRETVARAEMPTVYAAVNALQRTAWEVNPVVLQAARALFDGGERVAGLARRDDDPLPPVGERTAVELRRRFLVRRENILRASQRTEASRILWLAGRMEGEGAFHYPQQLDFRGRVYPVPQFLQPQGPDLARGLLRFAEGDWIELGREPREFWVHGANCAGYDKLPLPERVARARALDVRGVYADPLDCRWWADGDKPWQLLAWALEAGELLESGRVRTRVPCYVDGTNNGLQILSLLLRDTVGGAATNCLPGKTRRDVYQDVADEVTRRLRDEDGDTAREWLSWFTGGRLPRGATKRAVMTLPYGCTRHSMSAYLADWYEEEVRQGRTPPWPESERAWPRLQVLSAHLWAAIRTVLGPALECLAWLRGLSEACVGAGIAPAWVAPSGFPVRQPYTNWSTLTIRTKFGEQVRWVRSRRDGSKLNPRRHKNGLPPNFVHSLDAALLARAVSEFAAGPGGPVSTIHDSFGTTAARVSALAALVRRAYADAFSTDLLADLVAQLQGNGRGLQLEAPPARGDLDPRAVIGSDYLFS